MAIMSEQVKNLPEDLSVNAAWKKIQEMVQEDNLVNGGQLSQGFLKRNMQMQESSPENSVARLLPAEWRGFIRTVYLLRRSPFYDTKEKLIDYGSIIKKSRKIQGLGPKTIPFVLAMRDLAIAEVRERSSRIS